MTFGHSFPRTFARIDSRDQGGTAGRQGVIVQTKKVVLWGLGIFVAYTIIHSPARSAELVQIGFQGISDAAMNIGEFMTQLVS
ncbi:hypothetical protein EKH77_16670 [Streptomyces luteoverticillatus]|uniref:Uncharacterized protein n=1 Tax=Streptomyces luteoverticillatus TaxID=66425 RepID=A0A3Q9FUY9_STRLT|nr:hypothetical protein EKH77_16670 [Streptomyces luteoverticillatus]